MCQRGGVGVSGLTGQAGAIPLPRALEAALRDPGRLALVTAPAGPSMRLGALPMPAELAARLTEVAGVLGVSVAEVVRRSVAAPR